MKSSYLADLARALSPLEVAAYLRSRGWREERQIGTKGALWLMGAAGEEADVLLPYDPQVADYVLRMAEVLRTLEATEGRPLPEIVRDIAASGADLLRFRMTGVGAREGSLPLVAAPGLVQNIHDLLLAAACAVIDPKPVYPTRKPAAALAYLQQVRFGQTERGSFTLTVASPVAPKIASNALAQAIAEVEEPFARRAVATALRAIEQASFAATKTAATGSPDAFQGAVASGVSANLCEAVANLASFCDPAEGLSIAVSWASSRPGPVGLPTRVSVPAAAGVVLSEVARMFRATTPQPDVELRGMVVRLERAEPQAEGTATLLALVEEQPRKVEVRLGADDYAKAVRAHGERLAVSCQGELARKGNLFRLDNARLFSVEE